MLAISLAYVLQIIRTSGLRKELCKPQDKNRQRVMAETGLSADGSPVVDIVEDLAVEEAAPQFAAQPSLPVISFQKNRGTLFCNISEEERTKGKGTEHNRQLSLKSCKLGCRLN